MKRHQSLAATLADIWGRVRLVHIDGDFVRVTSLNAPAGLYWSFFAKRTGYKSAALSLERRKNVQVKQVVLVGVPAVFSGTFIRAEDSLGRYGFFFFPHDREDCEYPVKIDDLEKNPHFNSLENGSVPKNHTSRR